MAEEEESSEMLSDVEEDEVATSSDDVTNRQRMTVLQSELDSEKKARKSAEESLSDLQNKFNRLKILAQEAIRKRDEAIREKESLKSEIDEISRKFDLPKSQKHSTGFGSIAEEVVRRVDSAVRDRDEAIKEKESLKSEIEAVSQMMVSGIDGISRKIGKFVDFSVVGLPRSEKYSTGFGSVAYGVIKRSDQIAEELVKRVDSALKDREEAIKEKELLKSEIETVSQMLVSGIDRISGKVGKFMNFSVVGLPRSEKYSTGFGSVAYGVIKRSDQIAEELVGKVESALKDRDEAREMVEQRNYEIAIEVSELEARIASLKDESLEKSSKIENLEKLVGEKDGRIRDLEDLKDKVDSQRLVVMEMLKNVSLAQEQISEIIENVGLTEWICSDFSESQFIFKDMDVEENLQSLLEGTGSVCELVKVAAEKVKRCLEERREEVDQLSKKVDQLLADKNHIGDLLRRALSSKMGEMRKLGENGHVERDLEKEDEIHKLAGILDDTVKASQMEIIELHHQVETLGAECSLLKSQLDAQAKDISKHKHQIKELEEKKRLAYENVEGLMMDISSAEEEIGRWKLAAEQEAAAGRAIEQEFETKVASLRKELEDAKQVVSELESKLKVKEDTSAAAIAARDAAEKSLRLADMRSARLRERLEELTQQLGESDISEDPRNRQRSRYVCWPWQWLGLSIVRDPGHSQESSNEMELSEPLI